jgi:hypothetical protein
MSSIQNETINYNGHLDLNISGSLILQQNDKNSGSFFSPFFVDEKKSEKKIREEIYLREEIGNSNDLESINSHHQNKKNVEESLEILNEFSTYSIENLNSSKVLINLDSFSDEEELFFSKTLDKKEDNIPYTSTYQINVNEFSDINSNSKNLANINNPDLYSSPPINELQTNLSFSCNDLLSIFQKKLKKLNKNYYVNFMKNIPIEDLACYEKYIKYFNEQKDYLNINNILKNVPRNYIKNFFLYYMIFNQKILEIIQPLLDFNTNENISSRQLFSNKNVTTNEKSPTMIKPINTYDSIKKKIEIAKLVSYEKNKNYKYDNSVKRNSKGDEKQFRERSREKNNDKKICEETLLIDKRIQKIREYIRKIDDIVYFNKLQDLVGVTRAISIRDSFENGKCQKIILLNGSKYIVFFEMKIKDDSHNSGDYKLSYKVFKRSK